MSTFLGACCKADFDDVLTLEYFCYFSIYCINCRDDWGRLCTHVTAIDALVIHSYDKQFRSDMVKRELNKVLIEKNPGDICPFFSLYSFRQRIKV